MYLWIWSQLCKDCNEFLIGLSLFHKPVVTNKSEALGSRHKATVHWNGFLLIQISLWISWTSEQATSGLALEPLPQVKNFKCLRALFTSEETAFNRPVSLHSHPHLWSWAMGHNGCEWLMLMVRISLKDRLRSSVICERLRVDPFLLSMESSRVRWSSLLVRMSPGRLPWKVLLAHPSGRRPWQAQGGEIISPV